MRHNGDRVVDHGDSGSALFKILREMPQTCAQHVATSWSRNLCVEEAVARDDPRVASTGVLNDEGILNTMVFKERSDRTTHPHETAQGRVR